MYLLGNTHQLGTEIKSIRVSPPSPELIYLQSIYSGDYSLLSNAEDARDDDDVGDIGGQGLVVCLLELRRRRPHWWWVQ